MTRENKFRLQTLSDNIFALHVEFVEIENFTSDLRDLQGKLIVDFGTKTSNEFNLTIDLSGYAKGIYLLNVTSETKKKVIKLSVQ